MGEVEGAGALLPGLAACLQPARGVPQRVGSDQELVDAADAADGCTDPERTEIEKANASLQRRGSDQELLERLAAQGFAGVEYDLYRSELVAYAYPVLRSWLRRGLIFVYCAARGRPVQCPEPVRAHLSADRDDRMELSSETAAVALNVFREHGLVRRKWTVEGGASLKTYFVGACLNAFPNVFRAWLKNEHDWLQGGTTFGIDVPSDAPGVHPMYLRFDTDPADAVASLQTIYDELIRLDPDLRELFGRIAFNADTFAEAGAAVGLSDRAVEGRLYRYRKQRAANEHRGQLDGGTS